MSEPWMLDATHDTGAEGLYAFCPVVIGPDGEIESITVGMTYLSDSPPERARFVGVFHSDGQAACDAWCERNKHVVERLLAERDDQS